MSYGGLSVFGAMAMQTAQCKWRNANGAMQMATQRNDETKPCKTRAKQTGLSCLLLYTVGNRQSQIGRVNDVIAHRKFPEKLRHPTFPDKLQPYFCFALREHRKPPWCTLSEKRQHKRPSHSLGVNVFEFLAEPFT